MKIFRGILTALLLATLVSACNGAERNSLPGAIYFSPAGEGIERLDLATGGVSTVMHRWNDGYGWDISWDGTGGVRYKEPPSVFETNTGARYILFDASNGATLREITYFPYDGDDGGAPKISPNGRLLALTPEFEDGLVILDMSGNVLENISNYGNTHRFKYQDAINWEAGGTILFKKDDGLWRTSADFSRAFKVRDIPFSDWTGHASASPDGTKIAISAGNHIWLMNADGSDFHAITESSQNEGWPVFSPDSQWLAITCNPGAASAANSELEVYVTGTAPHLCIIPADGQVYKVWPGEDNRVMHPQPRGATDSRGFGMLMRAGFVWRP
ncbi:MAG: hypothetical protein LBE21_10610 [Pseudomonadales bacterium]|jgi:hypothetical protein|nr:hypothetical protein [Pseudomonadales bacterium]